MGFSSSNPDNSSQTSGNKNLSDVKKNFTGAMKEVKKAAVKEGKKFGFNVSKEIVKDSAKNDKNIIDSSVNKIEEIIGINEN